MTKVERERLLHAALFFAQHTERLSAKKLFELLYLLDVRHFEQTGRTVTGSRYLAFDHGPVADEVAAELYSPHADMAALLRVDSGVVNQSERHNVRPADGASVDSDVFSPRQMSLLREIAAKWRTSAYQDIDVSMLDHGAWRNAIGAGRATPIDLSDCLEDDDPHRAYKLTVASDYDRRTAYLKAIS